MVPSWHAKLKLAPKLFFLPIEPTANLTIETRDGAVDTWSVSRLSVRRSWLAGRDGLLDCIEPADKIGDQYKDIVRDACAAHVLRDQEGAADLGNKHVRITKLVPAGDYFDQREHGSSFGKPPPFMTPGLSELLLAF